MSAVIACEQPADVPDAVLVRIATDPARRAELYGVLGEFCHECRNQLNALKLSFYLATRAGLAVDARRWAEQERRYNAVEQAFERLQQICRPMRLTPVRVSLSLLWDELLPGWHQLFLKRGAVLRPVPPGEPAIGDYDPIALRAALDALAEWRALSVVAGQVATFAWRAHDPDLVVEWSESPPPRPMAEADSTGDEAEAFVLPFVARVVAAHGGSVELGSSARFELRMRWPREIAVHE